MTTTRTFGPATDATRGASLVVDAIADGRRVARAIDLHLSGRSRLRVLDDTAPL